MGAVSSDGGELGRGRRGCAQAIFGALTSFAVLMPPNVAWGCPEPSCICPHLPAWDPMPRASALPHMQFLQSF